MRNTPLNWVRKAGASLLFTGYFPVAPGTVGSILTVGALWYVHHTTGFPHFPEHAVSFWLFACGLCTASMFLANGSQTVFGSADPGAVTVDECAGQFITFFLVPFTWRTALLGFLLFRFFDIVKPWPVHAVEEIEGGAGITLDDVIAGILANLCLHGTLWGYHAVKAFLN